MNAHIGDLGRYRRRLRPLGLRVLEAVAIAAFVAALAAVVANPGR